MKAILEDNKMVSLDGMVSAEVETIYGEECTVKIVYHSGKTTTVGKGSHKGMARLLSKIFSIYTYNN